MNINDMTFDQLVPSESKYLGKSDVTEDGIILTIKGFRTETLKNDDGEEQKTVLHFHEDVKPMVINRTNAQLIGIATGAKTAGDARGKKIVVFNDPTVGFGGKITGGLRIKKVAGMPAAPAQSEAQDNNDDIPW